MDKLYRNKEWLEHQYITLKKSGVKIAKEFRINDSVVYRWLNRFGITRTHSESQKGELNANWQGGKIKHYQGNKYYYLVQAPDHPNTDHRGYVREHRLIMEQYLGRYLDTKEVVHHINGDTLDNRVENLYLFSNNGEHVRLHNLQRSLKIKE